VRIVSPNSAPAAAKMKEDRPLEACSHGVGEYDEGRQRERAERLRQLVAGAPISGG
jgi:hypothetical protein